MLTVFVTCEAFRPPFYTPSTPLDLESGNDPQTTSSPVSQVEIVPTWSRKICKELGARTATITLKGFLRMRLQHALLGEITDLTHSFGPPTLLSPLPFYHPPLWSAIPASASSTAVAFENPWQASSSKPTWGMRGQRKEQRL